MYENSEKQSKTKQNKKAPKETHTTLSKTKDKRERMRGKKGYPPNLPPFF